MDSVNISMDSDSVNIYIYMNHILYTIDITTNTIHRYIKYDP